MMVTDLRPTDEVLDLRARVRSFMEEHVYPAEPVLAREDDESDALVERLRALVKEQGLWAPHLPPEAGGSNGSFLVYAHLNEEIGRSIWGQLVFGCQAPDENHLWPSITHSSPSRTARVRSVVGSEPGTSGSVIEKNERISPATSGRSQRPFCSSVPNIHRISALPASGAWQPKTSWPQIERPISSFRWAYTRKLPLDPPASGAMCGAHRPCSFADARSRSTSASAASSS